MALLLKCFVFLCLMKNKKDVFLLFLILGMFKNFFYQN